MRNEALQEKEALFQTITKSKDEALQSKEALLQTITKSKGKAGPHWYQVRNQPAIVDAFACKLAARMINFDGPRLHTCVWTLINDKT